MFVGFLRVHLVSLLVAVLDLKPGAAKEDSIAYFYLTLRLHACRQPIWGAGCETNTSAQSPQDQRTKIIEVVLP